MNIDQVKTWGFNEVKSFVCGTKVLEGWSHDFKGISLGDSLRIRRVFCAYANTNGGIILHGINNQIQIKGTVRNIEIKTQVSRATNTGILPKIPIGNWDISEIKIPRKDKYLYLIYVYPSLYTDRPHVTEQKVYTRGNGTCDPVEDGGTLRKLFLIDKFFPQHIFQFDHELKKIKECRLYPDVIDFMYFKQLKNYLENRQKDGTVFNDLLNEFRGIVTIYENIKGILNTGVTYSEITSTANDQQLNKISIDLEKKIEFFTKKFKLAHGI